MSSYDKRKDLGDRFLSGCGIEIGAGLVRTPYSNVTEVLTVDKRGPEAFEAYFGAPSPHRLHTLEEATCRFPAGADFLMAHHVIEHCDDPIAVLSHEWIPLLRNGGILFLSLPSSRHSCEQSRLATPLEHILDDFYFNRSSTGYESKAHIYSFILQWTRESTDNFWYAKGDVSSYAAQALQEVLNEQQDLHWHTYTLAVLQGVLEVAFYAAGLGVEWLWAEESEDHHLYLVGKRIHAPNWQPQCLVQYRERLCAAIAGIDRRADRDETFRNLTPEPQMHPSDWNQWTVRSQQRFLETLPGDIRTICDVGAGAGAHCAWFAQRGFHPTAVDFFQDRFEHHGKIEFFGSVEPLIAMGRTFDAVFASHVLEHCPDMRSALREWRRLVHDDGYLIVVVPSYVPNACNGHWTTGWNIAQLAVLLVTLGFDCREASFFDMSGNVCGWGRKAAFAEFGDYYLEPALRWLPAGLRKLYFVDDSGNSQLPGNITAAFPDGRTEP